MPKILKIFIAFIIIIILAVGTYFYLARTPKMIEIVLAEEVVSLNPYTFTTSNDQLLRNLYNSLVRLDEKMNIKPSLAVSYGRIDDYTWDFRLTPNAVFHDGSQLTTKNVEHTFDELKKIDNSKSLTDSIQELIIIDDYNFQIKTQYKDPILLNKLALLPIIPMQNLESLLKEPNGTGPYIFDSYFENTYILKRNPNYFGPKATYKEIRFTTISDKDFRIQYTNINPKVIMIAPFPSDLKKALTNENFTFKHYPNLSVNFFLFNFQRPVFQNLNLRKILIKSIRDQDLLGFSGDSVKPTNQFISNGVFGFDPNLKLEKYETKPLELAVKNQGYFGIPIKIALPKGLDSFAEFLQSYWFDANLRPEIDLLPYQELTDTSTRENYDLIFLGWRSDYGEASQFFESFTLDGGEFNIGAYHNEALAEKINEIQNEFDIKKRQQLLTQAMKTITQDEPLGIPLFETEVLFAIQDSYSYTPRADGYIDTENLKHTYHFSQTIKAITNFLNQKI